MMRKLAICCAVAFVTFSIGVIVVTLVRTRVTRESNPPAAPRPEVHIEIKPPQVQPAEPDTKAPQQTDLTLVIEDAASEQPSSRREYIKLVKQRPAVIDLDITESVDDQEVILNFPGDDEYRVSQRYRTSMSVSAEGPHLDLIGWRHFNSPWIPLKAKDSRRFRTLAPDQMDDSRFPATTNEDIVKEVRRRVGKDWPEVVELVKDCRGPNDGACIVTISSIFLRVEKRVGDQWIDVGTVEVRIPMGC